MYESKNIIPSNPDSEKQNTTPSLLLAGIKVQIVCSQHARHSCLTLENLHPDPLSPESQRLSWAPWTMSRIRCLASDSSSRRLRSVKTNVSESAFHRLSLAELFLHALSFPDSVSLLSVFISLSPPLPPLSLCVGGGGGMHTYISGCDLYNVLPSYSQTSPHF